MNWLYKNNRAVGISVEGEEYTFYQLGKDPDIPLNAECIRKRAIRGKTVYEALSEPSRKRSKNVEVSPMRAISRTYSAVHSMRWI